MVILGTLESNNLDEVINCAFNRVHSSSKKNAKSGVRKSKVCYLHTTHLGLLKAVGGFGFESQNRIIVYVF